MTIELLTRSDAADVVERFSRSDVTADDVRRWATRIVAAEDCEIVDEDAGVIAAVINLFEDAAFTDEQLKAFGPELATTLRLAHSPEETVLAVIALVSSRERYLDLVNGRFSGRISPVGFENAVCNTDLSLSAKDRLLSASPQLLEGIAGALQRKDVSALATLLSDGGALESQFGGRE